MYRRIRKPALIIAATLTLLLSMASPSLADDHTQSAGQHSQPASLNQRTSAVPAAAPPTAASAGNLAQFGDQDCDQIRAELRQGAFKDRKVVSCFGKATSTSGRTAAGVTPAIDGSVPSWCLDDEEWLVDRTEACDYQADYEWEVIDIENGEILYEVLYDLSDDVVLDPTSAVYEDEVDFHVLDAVGEGEADVMVEETCAPGCEAGGDGGPFPLEPGETIAAAFSVVSDVPAGSSHLEDESGIYTFDYVGEGTAESSATWETPDVRCDDQVDAGAEGAIPADDQDDQDDISITTPGCVIPAYIPVLTTMTQLPYISANIAAVQAAGPNHYGQYPDGAPLTRGTTEIKEANRKAACPSSQTPPSGAPGPNPSCDEYPFASSRQGASLTEKPDWGTAWVPLAEQKVQGGLLKAFYAQNRIHTDGSDPFLVWV